MKRCYTAEPSPLFSAAVPRLKGGNRARAKEKSGDGGSKKEILWQN